MSQLRIGHASDLHCCERNRLDDWVSLHQTMVDQMREAGVDLILLTGDLFHARSTVAERNAMAAFLIDAAQVAPVVVTKGNHDAAGDLDIFECLSSSHPIHVYDRPTVGADSALLLRGFGVVTIPWFDRAHLVAQLDATVDQETTRNMTIEAAREMLTCLRAEAARVRGLGVVPILAGHVMVAGSETSTGQTLIGTTVELAPADLLDVGAECVALGHIHKAQAWFDGRVAYAGSTWRQNFGETEAKGWRLVTFEDGRFASNELVELPARRIVLFEGEYDTAGNLIGENVGEIRPGDLVRFRYRVPAEGLHAVNEEELRRSFLADGAHEVKLEAIVVQETRVRSEAIVTAQTNWDRLLAFFAAKGIDVDETTRARIRAKLDSIEARSRIEVAA